VSIQYSSSATILECLLARVCVTNCDGKLVAGFVHNYDGSQTCIYKSVFRTTSLILRVGCLSFQSIFGTVSESGSLSKCSSLHILKVNTLFQ
jgi:hypothetical protein